MAFEFAAFDTAVFEFELEAVFEFVDGLEFAVGLDALANGLLAAFVAGVTAPAGLAPLSSLGLSTTLRARKFSILASFIAIA